MAKQKKEPALHREIDPKVEGLRGSVTEEAITRTLETN